MHRMMLKAFLIQPIALYLSWNIFINSNILKSIYKHFMYLIYFYFDSERGIDTIAHIGFPAVIFGKHAFYSRATNE